jgi:hypothetical protein
MEEQSKKVDEGYKEKVGKEKGNAESTSSKPQDSRSAEDFSVPEASISFFITTLAMQATIALGDAADPQTKKSQENLPQAKFLPLVPELNPLSSPLPPLSPLPLGILLLTP